MRAHYYFLVFLAGLLLLAGAASWQLSTPVTMDTEAWTDHAGPFQELHSTKPGLAALNDLATGEGNEEARWAFQMPGVTERRLMLSRIGRNDSGL